MRQIITGQILLIICCIFYLIWWYLGYRPGTNVNRVDGVNGILLFITAFFGMAGVIYCLMPVEETSKTAYKQLFIVIGGIVGYIVLMLITKHIFDRVVTTELFLIIGWAMLELSLLNRLSGSGMMNGPKLVIMYVVTAAAFIVSMILYVAYYRMEAMRAFYAAMVPLVTEGLSMGVLVLLLLI